jgi:hypothetical protein
MACCLADALQVPHVLNHVRVTTIERLDQSHLYPKLEDPRLTCPAGNQTQATYMGSEHSRKEPSRQLVNRNIYI